MLCSGMLCYLTMLSIWALCVHCNTYEETGFLSNLKVPEILEALCISGKKENAL